MGQNESKQSGRLSRFSLEHLTEPEIRRLIAKLIVVATGLRLYLSLVTLATPASHHCGPLPQEKREKTQL